MGLQLGLGEHAAPGDGRGDVLHRHASRGVVVGVGEAEQPLLGGHLVDGGGDRLGARRGRGAPESDVRAVGVRAVEAVEQLDPLEVVVLVAQRGEAVDEHDGPAVRAGGGTAPVELAGGGASSAAPAARGCRPGADVGGGVRQRRQRLEVAGAMSRMIRSSSSGACWAARVSAMLDSVVLVPLPGMPSRAGCRGRGPSPPGSAAAGAGRRRARSRRRAGHAADRARSAPPSWVAASGGAPPAARATPVAAARSRRRRWPRRRRR